MKCPDCNRKMHRSYTPGAYISCIENVTPDHFITKEVKYKVKYWWLCLYKSCSYFGNVFCPGWNKRWQKENYIT